MKTTINNDGLKNSLAVSAGLHVFLMLFLYFGFPILFKPLPSHHDPVPFEIVEIADITNTRTKDQDEPQKPPAPAVKPAPPAPAPPTPPAPPQKPQPQPPQTKPVEPKPQAESIMPKPAEHTKPVETPKPKADLLASVLNNVAKLKTSTPAKTDAKADAKQPPEEAKSMAPSLSTRLTITEEDLLRRQIQQCWNMPIGARDAQNLIVEIAIDVNPDRTVQRAEVVDQNRVATDTFFRAAAESALRALKNPKCSPLELPADKYDQWKHIDFTFDPRDML